jgi:hypothetical protein
MRIQPEYMSFKNRCTISSSYEFQAHQQRSQRRCCFSQNALLWFEVLPDTHRFVAGAPRCSTMQRDPSPGRQAACNSPSEGTRFRQRRQSRPDHPGVSDWNQGCCWCTFTQLQVNQSIGSQLLSLLPSKVPPPCWPPSSIPPISHDHGLQVNLRICSITVSKCISKLAQLWPQSLHHYGLRMHLQTSSIAACKWNAKLAQSRPPSKSPHSLDCSLQVYLQPRLVMASTCISKLARSRSPTSSPNSLDNGLEVHLQTCWIAATVWISEFTRSSVWGGTSNCSHTPPAASPDLLYLDG